MIQKIITLVLLAGVVSFFSPRPTYAQTPSTLQFGGLVTFVMPCTCSLGISIGFTPLWLGSTPTVGLLSYTPGVSLLHEGYKIGVPSSWHLGQYVPGVQTCFVATPVGCVPIPNTGFITRVGTSVPGPI